MRIVPCLLSLALLFATGGVAAAQDASAPATYGSTALTSGFNPDPYTVTLTAGGAIQASTTATGCTGNIASAPDFELTYTAGAYPLTFRTAATEDTTLVINGPDGQWYCDDDGGDGNNAQVQFPTPSSGVYDVWVGSYSGAMVAATLQVTEVASTTAASMPEPAQTATYGSVTMASGFNPDPYTVSLTAGGDLDASAVGAGCSGKIARAPDFELTYTAGRFPLAFHTVSASDTTLVVNGPNGQWYCDDDSGGDTNAAVQFVGPASGVYDVWVGSYAGTMSPATLEVTELVRGGGQPVQTPPVGGAAPAVPVAPAAPAASPTSTLAPEPSLTATYGEITLHSGFTPDPRRIPLRAGGNIPAANASATCTGSIARAPDYQITYTAGRQPLIIRTESTIDTTLVVNDPDGVWHCDDDSGVGEGNAEVNLDKPSPGIYDIWVGTFGGGTGAATLILTEKTAPAAAAH